MKKSKNTFYGIIDFIRNGAETIGQRSDSLTEETMNHLIDNLKRNHFRDSHYVEEFSPHHIDQNGCEEKMKKAFGFSLTEDQRRPEAYLISGYPVYSRGYVPEGEMWVCSKSGRIIKRVKLL